MMYLEMQKISQAELPQPALEIGGFQYYTIHQIAAAVGVPAYHVLDALRRDQVGGRKLGKVYLVDAQEFNEWVRGGNFQYSPRKRYVGSLEAEVEDARRREEERNGRK